MMDYKKGLVLCTLLMGGVLVGLVVSGWGNSVANLEHPSAQLGQELSRDRLYEIARHRFKIRALKVGDHQMEEQDLAQKNPLKNTYIDLLLNSLVQKRLAEHPEFVVTVQQEQLALEPRLIVLSQQGSLVPPSAVYVATTSACNIDESKIPKTLSYHQLESELCMDLDFDYPGGFSTELPFSWQIRPLAEIDQWPVAGQKQQDNLVRLMKNRVAQEALSDSDLEQRPKT